MNLGEVLASARTASRLSLEDLAAITSIRPGLLSEMERNNFANCGGDIYAKGHLRNIAPKIGLDAHQLVELFNQEHSAEVRNIHDLLTENNVARVPHEKKNLSWKVPAGFSLAIVLALAVVQIIISNVDSNSPVRPVVESASPTPTPVTSESAAPTEGSDEVATGGGVEMIISAVNGNSLIDIVINGEHVFKGSIFQGETKTFTSESAISIYFSNPAGLDVTVNGELLPPLGGQNEEVRRTFR